MSHLLSPKFLPTQSSQQMAAPGTVQFGNRETQGQGRDQASPDTSAKAEDTLGLPAEDCLSPCDSKTVCLVPLGPLGLLI